MPQKNPYFMRQDYGTPGNPRKVNLLIVQENFNRTKRLLLPYSGEMAKYPVNPQTVNNARNNSILCLDQWKRRSYYSEHLSLSIELALIQSCLLASSVYKDFSKMTHVLTCLLALIF
jgi:hypothetical protein